MASSSRSTVSPTSSRTTAATSVAGFRARAVGWALLGALALVGRMLHTSFSPTDGGLLRKPVTPIVVRAVDTVGAANHSPGAVGPGDGAATDETNRTSLD